MQEVCLLSCAYPLANIMDIFDGYYADNSIMHHWYTNKAGVKIFKYNSSIAAIDTEIMASMSSFRFWLGTFCAFSHK